MKVRVVYCKHCYAKQARAIADGLRGRADAELELVEGQLSQLDVYVDGELVATRGDGVVRRTLARAPDVVAIVAAIEQRVSSADGDACELPDARERP